MEYLYLYLFIGFAMTVVVYYNDIKDLGDEFSLTWYDPLLGLVIWPFLLIAMFCIILARIFKSYTTKRDRRKLEKFLNASNWKGKL